MSVTERDGVSEVKEHTEAYMCGQWPERKIQLRHLHTLTL